MNEGRKAPRDRGNRSPITAARMAAGLTQSQLAKEIGCSQKDISRWESGKHTPRIDVLLSLAATLGCTVEELIDTGRE